MDIGQRQNAPQSILIYEKKAVAVKQNGGHSIFATIKQRADLSFLFPRQGTLVALR